MEDFTKSFKMERFIPSFFFFFFLFSLNSQSILHRLKNIFDKWKISRNLSKWNDLFHSSFFFLSSLNTQSILRNFSRWNDRFHSSFFFFWFSLNRFYIDLFDSILHIFDRWKISWNLSKWNNLFHPFFFFFYPH